jgi:hypothetical protein
MRERTEVNVKVKENLQGLKNMDFPIMHPLLYISFPAANYIFVIASTQVYTK